MPNGPEWHCHIVMAQGDIIGENRSPMVEDLELWYRDPVDCMRELLSNPTFKDYISFAPEHVYSDSEGRERILMRCGPLIGGGKCRWVKLRLL